MKKKKKAWEESKYLVPFCNPKVYTPAISLSSPNFFVKKKGEPNKRTIILKKQ